MYLYNKGRYMSNMDYLRDKHKDLYVSRKYNLDDKSLFETFDIWKCEFKLINFVFSACKCIIEQKKNIFERKQI